MGNFETQELPTALDRDSNGDNTPSLDMLLVLVNARRQIAIITLCFIVVGAGIAFSLKNTFTATATILPPQAPQSTAAALMGQLGPLAALGGAGGLLKSPADTYVGMLRSRTIADEVINKFHLMSQWKLGKLEDARNTLKQRVQFESAKDGLIVITAEDHDPNRASEYANAFVDGLYHMNASLAVTEAGQRRTFFDQQLSDEKEALTQAENELKAVQEKTGIITLPGQSEMAIRSIAQTRAEIKSREVELQVMRTYATDENPDVIRLRQEISTLNQQLAARQNDQQKMPTGDTEIPAGRVPQEGLEYVRMLRELKYHETLFELLSRQYAAARIDEAKSAPVIQIVDRAVPPDRKSGPPRTLILITAAVVGLCFGCLWAFFNRFVQQMEQTPGSAVKLNQLRNVFHMRT